MAHPDTGHYYAVVKKELGHTPHANRGQFPYYTYQKTPTKCQIVTKIAC